MKWKPSWLLLLLPLAIASMIALSSLAHAQDASLLRPPKGANLALVVFEDLECPQCSRVHPLLENAARTYKIPLVRYDFPIVGHTWSFDAALVARYFDTKSKKLGDEYRDYIFLHQSEITKDNLRGISEKFAAERHTPLPFVVDPQGKLAAGIKADRDLGERVGIRKTPTVYIVSNSRTTPFVEVEDTSQLFQMIDSVKAE
jgi:protein-disulfide isomerase